VRTLFLLGNPNVGKSAIFSRLTGLDVILSNYPGTTVEFVRGQTKLGGETYQVVDVPGTYSLEPTNRAEQVAVRMLDTAAAGDVVLNVLDAANLERNLFLTLQLIQRGLPMVVALNRWDMTKSRGIEINVDALAKNLTVPVVAVVGISGEGVKELSEAVLAVAAEDRRPRLAVPLRSEDLWRLIGTLCAESQKLFHHHPSFLERVLEISVRMPWALLIALGVLAGTFACVRAVSEWLIAHVLDPFFMHAYLPGLLRLARGLHPPPWLADFLLGAPPVPMESFGLLTTALYIPLVILLPYIFSFYVVLSFLEDSGYLVRLATALDRVFHPLGLHGYASIPILLGLGCKVPAVAATRILESDKERQIALVLILLLAPCLPQSAMIYSVLIRYGLQTVVAFFFLLLLLGLGAGLLLNRLLKGETPELFVEIPPYQLPGPRVLIRKVYLRLKNFLVEAVPMIVAGIALVNVLELTGLMGRVSDLFSPLVQGILGLPKEMSVVMISGFLRKDVAIGLLIPFHLTWKQLVIASLILVIYLPCVATFSMMVREFSLKIAVKISALTLVVALLLAGILNWIL